MKATEEDCAALDKYFGNRVYGWFKDGRDSSGNRLPSKSKLIRELTREQLELAITVLGESLESDYKRCLDYKRNQALA